MEVSIVKADLTYIKQCCAVLQDSDLGRAYFIDDEKAVSAIKEGITKKELFVALDAEGNCTGFIWFIPNGAFHGYPYLHIIAVKKEYRGTGIGKQLLRYFEEASLAEKKTTKLFLVVSDYNSGAKRLYESVGYQEIATIPDLYKHGVSECLMMKTI